MTATRSSSVAAIIPCNDIDAAELWWAQPGFRAAEGDEEGGDYRILSDSEGGHPHLPRAVEGRLVAGQNPFALYLPTPHVDDLAKAACEAVVGERPCTSRGGCTRSRSTDRTICWSGSDGRAD